MKLSALRACFCSVLILAFAVGVVAVSHAQSKVGEGEPFPSIALPDVVVGDVRDVRELVAGRVGAVIFMQTTCGVCKKELRVFEEFSQIHGDKLVVVAISVDSGGVGRVVGFKKAHGFPFPFLHDPRFETPGRFGLFFTPGLVLVGPDGKIEMIKSGFHADDKKVLGATIARLTSKVSANK